VSWGQIAASNLSDGLVIGTTALAAYLLARLIGDVRRGARTRRQAWALVGLIALAFPSVTLAYTVPRLLYLPHTSIGLGYHGLYDLSKQLTGHKTYGLVYGSGTGDIWPLRLALAPGVYLGAAALVLAGDFGGVRALEGPTSLTGVTRFASDTYCEGLATKDGVVPIPNVLPYDAPR
jgi:hypothetical protein